MAGGPGESRSLGGCCDHGVAVCRGVKVIVYFPQSRKPKTGAQLAEGERMERDRVFVYLELAAVVKDEHQMGDVLVAKAIRYLPGIEHHAPPSLPGHHPIGH